MKSNIVKKPFVFFECVNHFGGSNQSTILLIKEIQKYCNIIVLDGYGTCREYFDSLKQNGINCSVIQPKAKMTYIGRSSKSGKRRIGRLIASVPEMIRFIRRLRCVIEKINPRAI